MKKIIIVGGGVAGLTAGIYSQLKGVQSVVVEKNPGGAGAMCSWRRGEYEIDGCLHWLTGTKEGTDLYDIWKTTGVLGGVVKTGAFFTSETDGVAASFYNDRARTAAELCEKYPDDAREILRFFGAVRAASSLSGTEEVGAMSSSRACLALSPYALLSAGELACRFRNKGMRNAMCDLAGESFSSLGLIFAYAAYSSGNGYLPKGGSGGAAERMISKYKSLGGTYIGGKRAVLSRRLGKSQILLLDSGEEIEGDALICCTDPIWASKNLFGSDVTPRSFEKKLQNKDKYPVFSSVHFAMSAPSRDVPFKGTFFFPCRRHTLGPVNRARMMIREYSHEPSFSPRGMSVLQVMLFCGEEDCRRWIGAKKEGGAHYEEMKSEAFEEVRLRISERFPALGASLKLIDSWTPATFSRYLNSYLGSYMSFAVPPAVIPASFPSRLRDVPGVYFASGWSRSPGGVPNAASAGRDAAEQVMRDICP